MAEPDYVAQGGELAYINQAQSSLQKYLAAPASADNAALGQNLNSQLKSACQTLVDNPSQAKSEFADLSTQLTEYHQQQSTSIASLRTQYDPTTLAPSNDYLTQLTQNQQQIAATTETSQPEEKSESTTTQSASSSDSSSDMTSWQSICDTTKQLSSTTSAQEWQQAANQQIEYQFGLRSELASLSQQASEPTTLAQLSQQPYLSDFLSGSSPQESLYQSNLHSIDYQLVCNYTGMAQSGEVELSETQQSLLQSLLSNANPMPAASEQPEGFQSESSSETIDESQLDSSQLAAYQSYVDSLSGWHYVVQEAQTCSVGSAIATQYEQWETQYIEYHSQYSSMSTSEDTATSSNSDTSGESEEGGTNSGADLVSQLSAFDTLSDSAFQHEQMTQAKNAAFNSFLQSSPTTQFYQAQSQYLTVVSQYTPWLTMASASTEEGQESEYDPMLMCVQATESSLTQLQQYSSSPDSMTSSANSYYQSQYELYQQQLGELQSYQSQAQASQDALSSQCQTLNGYLNGSEPMDYEQIIYQSEGVNQFSSSMPDYTSVIEPYQSQYQQYQSEAEGYQSQLISYKDQANSQVTESSLYQQYDNYQNSDSSTSYLQQQAEGYGMPTSTTDASSMISGPYSQMIEQIPSQEDLNAKAADLINDKLNDLKSLSSQLPAEQYSNTCLSPQLCEQALDSLNQINQQMESVLSGDAASSQSETLQNLIETLSSEALDQVPFDQMSSWLTSLQSELQSECESWASKIMSNTPTQLSFSDLPALPASLQQDFDSLKSSLDSVVSPVSQEIVKDYSAVKDKVQQFFSSGGSGQSANFMEQAFSSISSGIDSAESKLLGYKEDALNAASKKLSQGKDAMESFFGPTINEAKQLMGEATGYLQSLTQSGQSGAGLLSNLDSKKAELEAKLSSLMSELQGKLSLNMGAYSSLDSLKSSIEAMLSSQQQFYSMDQLLAMKESALSSIMSNYEEAQASLTQLTSQLAPCPNISDIMAASEELEQNMQACAELAESGYAAAQEAYDDPYAAVSSNAGAPSLDDLQSENPMAFASAPTLDDMMENVEGYQQSIQQQATANATATFQQAIPSELTTINEQIQQVKCQVNTLQVLQGEANKAASSSAGTAACGSAPVTCMGSMMMCSFAVGPSTYSSLRATMLINNKPATTINDCIPIVNITPFPGCTAPTHPAYPANPSVNPCIPALSSFVPTNVLTQIQGEPVNTLNNCAMCNTAAGGVVQFVNPVQMTTFTE